jgi:hypothetical protein
MTAMPHHNPTIRELALHAYWHAKTPAEVAAAVRRMQEVGLVGPDFGRDEPREFELAAE